MSLRKFRFGNIWLDILSFKDAVEMILSKVTSGEKDIVSVQNMRTIRISVKNPEYGKLVNMSCLKLTDGMPLVWSARLIGFKETERITGPDLFNELLKPNYGLWHFFLGDTNDTLIRLIDRIKNISPSTSVRGYLSPPFKEELSSGELKEIADLINITQPDVIWVAMGSPKQDYFSRSLLRLINKGVIINVGAAFRFYLGEYRHPARIYQNLALEGVFWRFRKKPVSEGIWYLKHSVFFISALLKLVINRQKSIQ